MDDLILVGHTSGGGQEVVNRLRNAGFKTLKKIAQENSASLAEETGIGEDVANRVITAAKTLLKSRGHVITEKKPPKTKVKRKAKKIKKEKPKEVKQGKVEKKIPPESPIKKLATELVNEPDIIEATTFRLLGLFKNNYDLKEKIFTNAFQKPEFRKKLGQSLVRKLTS